MNIYPEIQESPLLIQSQYGTVELRYVPEHENFLGATVRGEWVAAMMDGEYKGKSESHHHHGWCISHLLASCASVSAVKLVKDALTARWLL